MFTKENLIAGETVLVHKDNPANKNLYLGNAGLVHFLSNTNDFECGNHNNFRIQELNEWYIIEQPKSKVVPLEKKVYDFVPVRCRDNDDDAWQRNKSLIAVVPDSEYPYKVLSNCGSSKVFKQCEFLN